ncbi:hypothetical protein K435DRAFT_724260 [Dendrothele bispora CBS 962.96]|uniref:PXA domain-containing protein n=1 Tax=Dendrothele bispora (strain CBS 962.96) TaxID=1314807 RepID=A0A4S8LYP1_DENBC|nr:hypothetical protein K435DRAFT_724260 [Dendrothele bispora CBS 962.96]
MSSLAKRLLFPNDPSLPLLLVSQVPDELNSELYDFIALALRAFVNPWWSKITRYDKQFLPEITRILTHVFRALEHRILTADLPPIIFCDVPTIVTVHYRDYRNAASKVSTSYASGGAMSLPQLFHQLQPHMAVSPDGVINPEYVRQILDVVLKACLPTEDYSPETERLIVREIILKIILNDVIPKVTQPWFIQKMILDQLGNQPVIKTSGPRTPPPVRSSSSQSFSFQTIIVFFLSAVQAISGACLAFINAYKQAMSTIKLVNQSSPSPRPSRAPTPQSHAGDLSSKRSTPSIRDPLSHSPTPSISSSTSSLPKSPVSPVAFPPHTVPVLPEAIPQDYAQPALLMVAEIFSTNERYASSTILGTVAMTASTFTPFVDRLLPYLLHNTLSSAFLFNIVRNAKRTLFPNGYPAPPPVDPTPEEQAEIRAKLLAWRPSGGAAHLLPLLLGPDPSETLAGALDPLSNKACNVHLILMILDRILMTLFPELEASTEQ